MYFNCFITGSQLAYGNALQVSSASAAVSSFDDVCEAFGDIAKLDNLVARGASSAAAAVLSPPGAPVGFDLSVALSWGVEKVVGSLGSLALLEGLVDKTLIDIFQQVFSALELAGSTFDTPWLRLGVAVAIAVSVRQAVVGYQAAHPQKLKRQLSPAASLSDALAEQAAAAVLNAAGLSTPKQKQQQQQQAMERQPTLAFAGCSAAAIPVSHSSSSVTANKGDDSSSSSSGSSSSMLGDLLSAAVKSPRKAVGPAALAGSTMLLLGQVKRANKIKKQVSCNVMGAVTGWTGSRPTACQAPHAVTVPCWVRCIRWRWTDWLVQPPLLRISGTVSSTCMAC
jgi:hypothetical protein